jgi:hypothetical protein
VVRQRIIRLALAAPTLSPRELAVRFTDMENYFVSEASVYRLKGGKARAKSLTPEQAQRLPEWHQKRDGKSAKLPRRHYPRHFCAIQYQVLGPSAEQLALR